MGAIASPMESHDLSPAISDDVSSSTSESCSAAMRLLNPEMKHFVWALTLNFLSKS